MLENFRLQVFHTLAREKSFSKTAKLLCLTQPAVSHQIQVLEEYLEARLFERKKGKVSLTGSGEILLKYSQQILNLYERAEKEIADLTEVSNGRLRIGASTTIGQYLVPRIIGEFKERFGGIEIFLINANTQEIAAKLLADSIDLGEESYIQFQFWLASMRLPSFCSFIPTSAQCKGLICFNQLSYLYLSEKIAKKLNLV